MRIKSIVLFFAMFLCACLANNFSDLNAVNPPEENGETQQEIELIFKTFKEKLEKDPEDVELLMALGEGYYSFQDYENASPLFETVLKLEPENQKAKIYLGLSYLFTNRLEQAYVLLKEALADEPQNPDILSGLGRIADLQHHKDEAEKLYAEALEVDPDHLMTLSFYGSFLMEEKRYQEAEETYKKIQQLYPEEKWIEKALEEIKFAPTLEITKQLADQGDIEEAIERYEQFISTNPQYLHPYLLLGRLYTREHRYSDALNLYQLGMNRFPDAIELINAMGFTYLSQKNFVKAKELFEKSLRKDSNDAEAIAGLGRIAALNGRDEEAEKLYDQALMIDPSSQIALTYYADLLMEQKNYAKAQLLYKMLLRVQSDAEWIKAKFSETKYAPVLDEIQENLRQKQYKAVEQLYEQLISDFPNNPDFYLALGQIYMQRKAYEEAIDLYELGLGKNPGSISLQIGLAFAHLHHNDLFIGQRILRGVLKNDPQNAGALVGFGFLEESRNNVKQAERLYFDALDLDPDNIMAFSYLGELMIKEKRYVEAQELFEEILQLDPQSTWAEEALERAIHGPFLEEIELKERENDVLFAEGLYLQLIAEAPGKAAYYLGLGRLYENNEQIRKAINLYRQGLQKLPGNNPLRIALGYAYLSQDHLEASARLLHSVLEEEPENVEALAGLGRIAEYKGDEKKAENLYRKALTYEQNNLTALSSLGRLLLKQKHFDEAQKIFQQLKRSYPDEPWVAEELQDAIHGPLLGKIHELGLDKDLSPAKLLAQQLLAEKLYRELISKAPNNLKYLFRLGLLYAEMKRFPEAISIYQRGLRIDPKADDLRVSMGFSYLFNKDFNRAKEEFQIVLENHPNNGEAWAGLGRIAELTENFAEAENDYENAIEGEPNDTTALSFIAGFQVNQGNYNEAKKYYEKLEELEPDKRWVRIAIQGAEFGPQLKKINRLIDDQEFDQAAKLYEQLIFQATYNIDYYMALGKLYLQRKLYEKAIQVLKRGLKEHPDDITLQTGLATAYVLDRDADNAKKYYDMVNSVMPNRSEVLAGLGRVESLKGHPKQAEQLYLEALGNSPDNVSALSFYGEFLMEQKRYDEAIELYERLLEVDPKSHVWIRRALKSAKEGPELDGAIALFKLGKYQAARKRLLELISISPDIVDYYYQLGEIYVACEEYDYAIEYYWQGLIEFYQQNRDIYPKIQATCCDPKNERLWCMLDPDNAYLWRAIAFAFLEKGDVVSSCGIFRKLVNAKIKDAESWTGIGRIKALAGHSLRAREDYLYALDLEPDKLTVLSYLALWAADAEYYFSARDLYGCLMDRDPQQRWIRTSYKKMYDLTRPRFDLAGAYHEENEWDDDSDKRIAQYQAYGWRAEALFPINDCIRVFSHVTNEYYRLKDLLDDCTLYDFKVLRFQLGAKWVLRANLTGEAALGLTSYFPTGKKSTFKEKTGVIPEPTLLLNYHEPKQRATIGISSSSYGDLLAYEGYPFYRGEELIARDFEKNRAKLVGRYFILGQYEREASRQTLVGLDGAAYLYDDFVKNSSQRLMGWALWRPSLFSNTLVLRYQLQYWRFRKNIPDYYSFRYQISNQIQAELNKDWCDSLYLKIGYAHGWLDTRTRFGQIIVVPSGTTPESLPFFTQHRNYHYGYCAINYKEDSLQLSINGDYYRDSKKYTMWTVYGKLSLLF